MKLCLDNQKFTSKPDKHSMAAITKRIAGQQVDVSVENFAIAMERGQSFTPAYFIGAERKNEYWEGQTIFALDFDDGITVEEVLERCKNYGQKPAFIYETFSSISQNKFRVIFVHNYEVTDYRVRTVIQIALMTMFKESDKACKDASRFFAGGKGLLYEDFAAEINVVDLLNELCRYITENNKVNASRDIKTYCETVGVDMFNGMPKVLPQSKDNAKIEENTAQPIYITSIGSAVDSSKTNYAMYFSNTNTPVLRQDKPKKFKVTNEVLKREYLRRFDFDKLYDECRLWHDFADGEHWAVHSELFGIATNLLFLEGGREKFMGYLKEHEILYQEKVKAFEYYCNDIIKRDYAPMRCESYCPFVDTCDHAKNIIEQVKTNRGRVNVLSTPEYKTLAQAEHELKIHFDRAKSTEDKKIYVIKAPTGIGKTELYLNVKNTTVCLPTHKLKNEVAERMESVGNQFITSPELPSIPEYDEQIQKLYDAGAYGAVSLLIRKLAKEKQIPELMDYLKSLERLKKAKGTILTTHARALYLKDTNNTMIIDEDIIPTLLKVDSISLEDLNTVVNECISIDAFSKLQSIQRKVNTADVGIVEKMPSYFLDKKAKLESILVHNHHIKTNIMGFLNCDYFVKEIINDKVVIFFVNKSELPDKKIIIMSATANETICKLMFGDRLEFIDIGNVQTVGRIKQYPQHSYSRYQLKDNTELIKLANAIVGDKPVITYKQFTEHFANCVMTFGATAGIDAYSGKDIVVVGTPHANPITYLLFANALGKTPRMNDSKTSMEYQTIKRNGFSFWFQTYSDDDILREIQMYIVESELNQAIGRSRILRKDCTVTLLSNLPVVGAEFIYLTKDEEEKMIREAE